MDDGHDLPEGVIDADPPGGWESGDAADGETEERNEGAAGSPRLTDAGSPARDGVEPDGPVESTEPSEGVDPDLTTGYD